MNSRTLLRALLWFFSYLGIGLLVSFIQPATGASLWYPPIAVGLLLLLLHGFRYWPVIFVADFVIANYQYQQGAGVAAVVAGNTVLEIIFAALLLTWIRFDPRNPSNDRLLRFSLVIALATGLGASLGCFVLSLLHLLPGNRLLLTLRDWWLGDMTTILCLLLPLLLLFFRERPTVELAKSGDGFRQSEVMVLWLGAVGLVLWLAIGAKVWTDPAMSSLRPLAFVPILWAAVRLKKSFTALLIITVDIVTVLALWLLVPVIQTPPGPVHLGVLDLQIFMIVLSLGGVGLSMAIDNERRLRSNEQWFRTAMEWAPLPSMIHAEDGEILLVSDAWREISGYSLEDIPTMASWVQKAYGENWQAVLTQIQQLYGLARRKHEGDYQITCKDGSTRTWVFSSMALGNLPDGRRMAISMAADITERKQTLDLLRVFYDMPFIGMAITSPQSKRWLKVNDRLCEILGYSREQLLNLTWTEVTHPEDLDADLHNFTRLLTGEIDGYEMDKRFIRSDRQVIDTTINIRSVRQQDGSVKEIVATVQDVTGQRKLEEQLRQAEKMQAIGQLAGGVAHDFNNQLASILGYAEILSVRETDPQLQEHIKGIKTAVERAANLTRQLLSFGRKGKVLSVPVTITDLLREVVSILEHSIDKRISIRQQLLAGPGQVIGDPSQLQNAFLNVAINARDAMPEGGELTFRTDVVELDLEHCEALPQTLTPGRYLKISITDTGHGMDSTTRSHVFEPFFTTKAPGQGSGMGLASAYGAILSHKGVIQIDSEPLQGTTVSIILPLAEGLPDPPVETAANPIVSGSAHILVVDDEPAVRITAAEMLKELGYRVTESDSGRAAIEIYRKSWEEIDLVILDMTMPDLDGRETFAALQQINPHIRAILSSGYSINGKAQALLDQGVMAFISKPFNLAELSGKITRALGSSN